MATGVGVIASPALAELRMGILELGD